MENPNGATAELILSGVATVKSRETYLAIILAHRTSHLSTNYEKSLIDNQMNKCSNLICFTLDLVNSADTSRGPTDNQSEKIKIKNREFKSRVFENSS